MSKDHESLERDGLFGAGATRRGFLKTASLVTGGFGLFGLAPGRARAQSDDPENCTPPASPNPPVPFTPDTSQPVLPRKSAFDLTSSDIQLLQDAYGALRDLTQKNPEDPRGWQQQANVHCWYCGGGQDGEAGPEIHGSYRFFPWHRCYLYYHERILGKLVGNPNFRLPYWDWSDPSDRTLPPPYTNPNDASNPLFDQNRGASPTDQIPAQYVNPTYMQGLLSTTRWQVFMGTDFSAGNVENGPHGLVHIFVGDPTLQAANQDMGILATAAQDPVFFAHHSNIDRYWDVWLQQGGGRTNPTDAGWATQTWTFYDENSVLRSITAGDVVNFQQNLRYSYGGAAAATDVAPLLSISSQQNSTLGPDPLTRKVAVPGAVRSRLLSAAESAPQRRSVVLHIEGIEHAPTQAAVVHVFANKPGATAATELSGKNFLGYFAIVPNSLRQAHSHGESHVVFDVSNAVSNLLEGQQELAVTLVPATAKGKPENTQITFDEIYLAAE